MKSRILTVFSLAVVFATLVTVAQVRLAFSATANGILPLVNTVSGMVELRGAATHPEFRKWQIDLLVHGDEKQAIFIALGEKQQPEQGVLTSFDTARYPDGVHTLRLRVVYTGLQYDEFHTSINIANRTPVVPVDPTAPTVAIDSVPAPIAPAALPTTTIPLAGSPVDRPATTGAAGYTVTLPISRYAPVADILAAQQVDLVNMDTSAPAGVHWIEIDLSDQTLTAYQGDRVVLKTQVSTGKDNDLKKGDYTLTVTGRYRIKTKYDIQRMRGRDYDTPNVPWVMYFFRGFAIHGAYWHNEFGTRVSHGCINMRIEEARQLYEWTEIGTEIIVHQ